MMCLTTLSLLVIGLAGCDQTSQSNPVTVKKYCISNGYSAFNPVCDKIAYGGGIVRGYHCNAGNMHDFEVINPTNVTECNLKP